MGIEKIIYYYNENIVYKIKCMYFCLLGISKINGIWIIWYGLSDISQSYNYIKIIYKLYL